MLLSSELSYIKTMLPQTLNIILMCFDGMCFCFEKKKKEKKKRRESTAIVITVIT